MPTRVLTCFLALVLLWSGLSTVETPLAFAPTAPTQHDVLFGEPAPASVTLGSVEDHHLDDLPLQAQGDVPADTPAPHSVLRWPGLLAQAELPPCPRAAAPAGTPCLAGPLRPPCADRTTG